MALDLKRRAETEQFLPGQYVNFDRIPRDFVYKSMFLFIDLSLTFAVGGNVDSPYYPPYSGLRRIHLEANGTDVIRNVSGEAAVWFSKWARMTDPLAWIGSHAADQSNYLQGIIKLDFAMPRSPDAFKTLLPAPGFSDLICEIQCGDKNDLFLDPQDEVTINSDSYISLYTHEIVGIRGDYGLHCQKSILKTIDQSNTDWTVDLRVSNFYRGILFLNFDDRLYNTRPRCHMNMLARQRIMGAAGNFINSIEVRHNGTNIRRKLLGDAWVQESMLNHSYHDSPWGWTSEGATDTGYDQSHGAVFIDFSDDGSMNGWLNTAGWNSLVIGEDVRYQNSDDIWQQEITPIEIVPFRS